MDVEETVRSVTNDNVTLVRTFVLPDPALEITQEIRTMCEQNLCGYYGINWTCPPNVPPCDTCRMLLSKYEAFVLVRTTYERRELFDPEEMAAMGKAHNDHAREIRKAMEQRGDVDFKILAAGGCSFCRKCSCPDEKCRFPSERMFSIESYGIDLTSFINSYGIEVRAGNKEQSYFTMVFYRYK